MKNVTNINTPVARDHIMIETFISRSEGCLYDVISCDFIDLSNIKIHCTFQLRENDMKIRGILKERLLHDLIAITFTNGESFESKDYKNRVRLQIEAQKKAG